MPSSYSERDVQHSTVEQSADTPRLERILAYLDTARRNEGDFTTMAAQLRTALRAGTPAELARVQQAAEQLLERHGLRL
jgi:hypothetical protein